MIGLVFPSLAGPVTVHLVVSWPASAGGDAPGKPRKRARSNVIPPVLKDLRERAEEEDEAADHLVPVFDDHELDTKTGNSSRMARGDTLRIAL